MRSSALRLIRPLGFALLVSGSVVSAQPDSDDAEGAVLPVEGPVEMLPPLEVTGHAPMGLKADIACKGLLLGEVVKVKIGKVVKNGRGAKLGVLKGDELIAINGITLAGMKRSEVYDLLQEVSQGQSGRFDLRRKGFETPIHIAWVLKGE